MGMGQPLEPLPYPKYTGLRKYNNPFRRSVYQKADPAPVPKPIEEEDFDDTALIHG